MPMATRAAQSEYQRQWIARRRAEFYADKFCAHCGTTENLELDHIDSSSVHPALRKIHNRAIWSWSKVRREAEIAKCQVLCEPCHIKKTRDAGECVRGEAHGKAKLTDELVRQLRIAYVEGANIAALARQMGVSRDTANLAARRLTWKHIN